MKLTLSIFSLVFSLNVTAEEARPILIKKADSFQLNPIDATANDAVFNYQSILDNCFDTSKQFKEKPVNYKIVTNIINQKIKSSTRIPTINCAGLITAYKEKINQ